MAWAWLIRLRQALLPTFTLTLFYLRPAATDNSPKPNLVLYFEHNLATGRGTLPSSCLGTANTRTRITLTLLPVTDPIGTAIEIHAVTDRNTGKRKLLKHADRRRKQLSAMR